MMTKLWRKGFSFLGVFFCLNAMRCQPLSIEGMPASGPWAFDGQLIVSADGTSTPVCYRWEGPNNFTAQTADIRGLAAGNYCVTVTTTNQKRHILCKYLTYVCPDTPFGIQVKQPTPGKANGALVLQLPLEKPVDLDIKWSTGDTAKLLKNLNEGYYALTITNSNGCTYYPGIHLFETEPEEAKIAYMLGKPPTKKSIEVVHSGVKPAASFGAVRKLAITALYPNPFQDQLFVELEHNKNTWITLVLQDCYHRHVYKDLRFATTGKNRFKLQLPAQLPKGLYILCITDQTDITQYQKIIHLPRSAIP